MLRLLFVVILLLSFAQIGLSNGSAKQCKGVWNAAIAARGPRERIKAPKGTFTGVRPSENIQVGKFQRGKSVFLVHIGKTCGSSVKQSLEENGIKFTEVHGYPTDSIMITQHDIILISIRDPLKRQISAFNWENPSTIGGLYHTGTHRNQSPSALVMGYFSCFENVDAYAKT